MATEDDRDPVSDSRAPSVDVWHTLILLQQIFADHRDTANNSMQRYVATIMELQSAARKSQAAIEALQRRTAFLLEYAYERLGPIEDERSSRFEWTGSFRRAPNYTVVSKTKWPIRLVTADPPESSGAWSNFPSYPTISSSCEFTAAFKLIRLASGWPRVELFGWRHEIHDAEISNNKATIQALQHELAQLIDSFTIAAMRSQEQKRLIHTYNAKLVNIEHDLTQLARPIAPIQQGTTPIQNIYTLCRAYGLVTKIKLSELPPGLKDSCEPQQCLPYFDTLKDLQELAKGLLTALQARYLDLLNMRSNDTSFFESKADSLFDKAQPSSLNYLRSLSKKDNAGENSIIQQALKSLETLDELTTDCMSRQTDSFKELSNERKTPPDMSEFECGLDDLVNDRADDLEATHTVRGFITDADMDVSVVTYLLAKESATEGWADVLDGVREDLAERKPTSPHREPETVIPDGDTKCADGEHYGVCWCDACLRSVWRDGQRPWSGGESMLMSGPE